MVVGHYHRSSSAIEQSLQNVIERQDSNPQTVHLWSVYISARHSAIIKDKVHALPVMNPPAHEWTTFTQLCDLNEEVSNVESTDVGPILIRLDMNLCKRV